MSTTQSKRNDKQIEIDCEKDKNRKNISRKKTREEINDMYENA